MLLNKKALDLRNYTMVGGGLKNVIRLGFMPCMKQGRIISNGVILEKYEYKTVLLFTEMGSDVELIPKSDKKSVRTSDIIMEGFRWELKSPKGKGR